MSELRMQVWVASREFVKKGGVRVVPQWGVREMRERELDPVRLVDGSGPAVEGWHMSEGQYEELRRVTECAECKHLGIKQAHRLAPIEVKRLTK